MRAFCCLAMIAVGCGRAADPSTFPASDELGSRHVANTIPEVSDGARSLDGERARHRFRMQRHFDDLRAVERLLIAGKLAEAKSRAFLLSRPAREVWSTDVLRVSEAALALAGATSLEEACRLEPQVAAACADCHRRGGSPPAFDRAPAVPPDDPSLRARMSRHQWAADRLWEGLVGGSDRAWRSGLEVLAAQPLSSPPDTTGRRLQLLAAAALDELPRDTPAARARVYGELLVTCVACHARRGTGRDRSDRSGSLEPHPRNKAATPVRISWISSAGRSAPVPSTTGDDPVSSQAPRTADQ